ncbi:transporter substrate-binding domain-containing protein [Aestuariirhabdus sp. Z084]|uniref:substrate-binding periplasmic protein n=1 Tax=Aestuariirhabdus haliotis TaxID=2918751 RepID=UPI00201B4253|nr:transporter substrate-binding domain-containing protein [Aestuariirhabdus haliotis]MCL6416438.1 transporter substrate-binding domain-containing protein [Aestuariirhabdus haliotis]MCL6420395.1 transporter substrate-binding domain-containing protein [Aestuariirhabdus haliotis]
MNWARFVWVLFLLVMPGIALPESANDGSAEDRPLVIIAHERPPWHFVDATGKVVGICVDIVDAIFAEMGLEYEVVDVNWARAWRMAEEGDGEAIFSTSRKTPREPYLYYPQTDMWVSSFSFFALKSNAQRFPYGTFEAIANSKETIVIERGASYNPAFWRWFPNNDGDEYYDPDALVTGNYNSNLIAVKEFGQALKMVALGRATFTLEDRITGLYLSQLSGLDDIVAYEHSLFSKGYPMPFIRNSNYPQLEQIATEFERRLRVLKNDGRYQTIVNRWLPQAGQPSP